MSQHNHLDNDSKEDFRRSVDQELQRRWGNKTEYDIFKTVNLNHYSQCCDNEKDMLIDILVRDGVRYGGNPPFITHHSPLWLDVMEHELIQRGLLTEKMIFDALDHYFCDVLVELASRHIEPETLKRYYLRQKLYGRNCIPNDLIGGEHISMYIGHVLDIAW
ncbi:hypothetical protein HOP61_13375 [Halomonas daqingensis]|uniref:Uncharacterized protein n=1 Tax=Billgrantia desiderata TaxID=52021 RepID=A0AAW4YUV9_9GAMM|nr:hypothetical protein [Halomonas desiderata]MCE8052296.1 hypothetical protein [Halomonas desiderata]